MRIAMTLLALALATGACKKKENTTAGNTTGSATTTMTGSGSAMAGSGDMAGSGSGSAMAGSGDMAGSGSAMAGSGDMAGSGAGAGSAMSSEMMSKHAGNCPSTVLGSTTTAAVKGKDVVITITSTDKDAIAAIQKRTDELLKQRMDKSKKGAGSGAGSDMAASSHDQRGTHGGSIGLCPVHIPDGATAKAKHEKNGVMVTITPKDKPDELKTEVDARITKAADWVKANIQPGDKGNQGGVGGVKNNEGANHSGKGDGKGAERKKGGGSGNGGGGGEGTGGGGGKGTGGGSAAKK